MKPRGDRSVDPLGDRWVDRLGDRWVDAPGLRETADIWFDTGRDPVVAWDEQARHFDLVDPVEPTQRVSLLVTRDRVGDPVRVARVLADGLAACDFPPTGDGADPGHVATTLRVAGLDPTAP